MFDITMIGGDAYRQRGKHYLVAKTAPPLNSPRSGGPLSDTTHYDGSSIQTEGAAALIKIRPRMYGLARTLCHSNEDAEDVVGQALINLWKALEKRTPKCLVAYALQSVRRSAYDFNERWDRPKRKYGFEIRSFGEVHPNITRESVWRVF